MTTAVQNKNPLQNLNCCTLLMQCEFIEIACRIKNAVVHVFCTIAQTIAYSVKWVLSCGRITIDSKLTDPAALLKLSLYTNLPEASPNFEKEALKLASVWLTQDEMTEITDLFDANLYSQIVVRATMLAGRSPLYFNQNRKLNTSSDYEKFFIECRNLNLRFNALPASDKLAMLDHLDSDITPIKENGEITEYRLTSSRDKSARPNIPPPATISKAARDLWTDYKALAHQGIKHDHPIMKGLGKST